MVEAGLICMFAVVPDHVWSGAGYCDVIWLDSRHLPDPDVEIAGDLVLVHSLPDIRHQHNLHHNTPHSTLNCPASKFEDGDEDYC